MNNIFFCVCSEKGAILWTALDSEFAGFFPCGKRIGARAANNMTLKLIIWQKNAHLLIRKWLQFFFLVVVVVAVSVRSFALPLRSG